MGPVTNIFVYQQQWQKTRKRGIALGMTYSATTKGTMEKIFIGDNVEVKAELNLSFHKKS